MKSVIQHQPLRKPQKWDGESASMVMQIDRTFDDLYRQITLLKERVEKLETPADTEEE